MTESSRRDIVRMSGEGEATSLFGDTYWVKATGDETGGTVAVIEAELAPHSSGTPLHINTREDENYYVLEGILTFRLDERTVQVETGTFVHIPMGQVTPLERHRRAGEDAGFPAPPGFEAFFAELSELMAQMPPGPPDLGRLGAFYGKYGLDVVGPPPSSEG